MPGPEGTKIRGRKDSQNKTKGYCKKKMRERKRRWRRRRRRETEKTSIYYNLQVQQLESGTVSRD